MSDPILSVEGLQVNYGRVEAVRNISFEVAAGALVTLVGANGAGKTSVLNAVSGLVRPRHGVIRFKGQDITKWPAHRLVKAGLVQVPEGREILGTLTVAENLSLGGWHRGSTLHTNVAGSTIDSRCCTNGASCRPAPSPGASSKCLPLLAH